MFRLVKFLRAKSGATAVEYGLVAAIISASLIAGLMPMGNSIRSTFDVISNAFESGD